MSRVWRRVVTSRKEVICGMAKRGRPVKDEARKRQYRLRLSEEEEAKLNYIQKKEGKTKAEILREGLDVMYRVAKG